MSILFSSGAVQQRLLGIGVYGSGATIGLVQSSITTTTNTKCYSFHSAVLVSCVAWLGVGK